MMHKVALEISDKTFTLLSSANGEMSHKHNPSLTPTHITFKQSKKVKMTKNIYGDKENSLTTEVYYFSHIYWETESEEMASDHSNSFCKKDVRKCQNHFTVRTIRNFANKTPIVWHNWQVFDALKELKKLYTALSLSRIENYLFHSNEAYLRFLVQSDNIVHCFLPYVLQCDICESSVSRMLLCSNN